IRTVFKENKADVMLITRPRRFGKTLTMSTFYDFLSLNIENPGDVSLQEKWFKGTKIFEDKEFCSKYMGKFPVIFISLKAVSGNDFIGAYEQFGSIIFNLYNSFNYLADSPKLSDTEIRTFKNVADNEDYICDIKNKNKIKNSLSNLLMFLYKHHGIKPILLIDEYDVPIAKAAHNGYYREMIDIISPFLSNALKTNLYLDRAVLTGCLRAAKESIFTGLNNLMVCSILDSGDDDISRGIGFTKEESEGVLSYYGLTDYYEDVRNNYDGYHFGTTHMYCPWDVMNFCNDNYRKLSKDKNLIQAGNYWINTSGNDVIEEFMGFIEPEDVELMQDLLDGKSITAEVRATLCYGDLQNHDINDFWTLLLYTGYLTFDPTYRSSKKNEYSLYIPNEEIRDCFRDKILSFFKTNSVMKASTGELVKGLFEGDAEKVQDNLNTLLGKYVSIRDFSVNAPKENYYHGFMNGLLVNGTSFIEEHKSNFESGDGYVDIIIASKNSDTVAILELKQTDKPFGARLIAAQKAVEQITEKGYAIVYMNDPLVRNVYAYGICFHKKSCSVVVKKMK
ncbi:AAA family ATPase, partial [Succinimonas amylolytica]|uniref:AAA family ATPase n=1 Tax=Succinimonas amylolytica TaxID=83769 RepID=UPI0003729C39